MKTQLILFVSFLFISFTSIAQDKNAAKSETIKVWGNCGMCKTTIEKAAKKAGASYASWNEDTKILSVKYNASKTDNAKIQKSIATAGYDTQDEYGSDEAYNNLHDCCKYDRKEKTASAATTTTTEKKCNMDSASCKKDGASCKMDHAKCGKDGQKKDCCSSKDAKCNHDGDKKDCCKKDKDAKAE